TRWPRDWSSDVCSSDLDEEELVEVSRGHSRFNGRTEGLNMKLGLDTQISMTARDAASRAEKLATHPEGSRRNWREEGLGASKVKIGRASCRERVTVSRL